MRELIVLMGAPGVGKGTFSKMLRAHHNFNYIETGAILRNLPADSEIAKIIARGDLVPDAKLFKLLNEQITASKDVLLDGFPRTKPQAQWLVENYAAKFNIRIVYLDVPEDIILQRIQKRLNEGGGRSDDADPAVVKRRLDAFRTATLPAIEWLRDAPGIKFASVSAIGAVEENFARITDALKN